MPFQTELDGRKRMPGGCLKLPARLSLPGGKVFRVEQGQLFAFHMARSLSMLSSTRIIN
jgi:hypothetical protein